MPFEKLISRPLPPPPWQRAPLLGPALCVMAGIVVAWTGREEVSVSVWMAAAAVMALTATGFYFFLRDERYRMMTVAAGIFALMCASACLLQRTYDRTKTEWPEEETTWAAQVQRVHQRRDGAATVDVCLADKRADCARRIVRVHLTTDSLRSVFPGDRFAFHARIARSYSTGNPGDFNNETYFLTQGVSGTAYAGEKWIPLSRQLAGAGRAERLQVFKERLVGLYAQYFRADDLAVISTLTLGDRSRLDADTRSLFAETGTSHILALSGLHLGILYSLYCFFVLKWVRRRGLRIVFGALLLAALWTFVMMAGHPVSLVRAAWMFTLLQIGMMAGRTINSTLNNLAFAALVILLVSPMSLFDVGFQLSFVAVLSIVVLNDYVWMRFPLPVYVEDDAARRHQMRASRKSVLPLRLWLRKAGTAVFGFLRFVVYPFFTVSLSAQIGTAPLVIYYFHTFPVYSLLANCIVIPAAYIVLLGALLFFFVPVAAFRAGVAAVLQGVLSQLKEVLGQISQWPCAVLDFYPSALTLIIVVLLPVCLYAFFQCSHPRRRRALLYAFSLLFASAVGVELYRMRPSRVSRQLIVYNLPRATVVHFVRSASESYVCSSVPPDSLHRLLRYVERDYFRPNGMNFPRILENPSWHNAWLAREGSCFRFAGRRLYVLSEPVNCELPVARGFLDVLLVSPGCFSAPSAVLRVFRPRRVVLLPGLPRRLCDDWTITCRSAKIPCHDVRKQGAFVMKL